MNFLAARCYREFTVDQATRMEAAYDKWRAANPNNVLDVAPPVATNDDAKTPANVPVIIDVLANDLTALDPDYLQIDRITVPPVHGTAVVSPDSVSISFMPEPGFTGAATFKYKVFDCNGVSAEATVNVDVQPSVSCATDTQRVVLLANPTTGACSDGATLPPTAVTTIGSVTYTQTPPGPKYSPGSYTIKVVPDNGTPSCDVKLAVTCHNANEDREEPKVEATHVCVYPQKSGHKGRAGKTTHCFTAGELATIEDDRPDPRLEVQSCRLVGPALPKHLKAKGYAPCTIKSDPARVCVRLDYLPTKKPRTIVAVMRGTDASGNFVEVDTTIKVYKSKPNSKKGAAAKGCKAV
jgi:hypothetical protein